MKKRSGPSWEKTWHSVEGSVLRPHALHDGYRCDACRRTRARCQDCRAARAAAQRATRARKRAAGLCVQCTMPATDGTLCAEHAEANRVASRESHARARAG